MADCLHGQPESRNHWGMELARSLGARLPLTLARVAGFVMLACLPAGAQDNNKAGEAVVVPQFRHIDPSRPEPDFKVFPVIRFAASKDFPPFSYLDKDGALTGFNVSIANAVCKVLRVDCRFVVEPFDKARRLVEEGKADALITGLQQNSKTATKLAFTKPYFRFSARFAVRESAPIRDSSARTLAGKRLGVVSGSQHAAFLDTYFKLSKIHKFKTVTEAEEGLRTGAVDALFDDSLRLMFWIKGSASKGCCRLVGDAYMEPDSFSQPITIAVKRDNVKLRALIDHALDRLQVSGRFAAIYRQYFPLSMWKDKAGKNK